MRGWQREQLVFGVGAFAKPGVSFEQEYLKTLLLMRLDSGKLHAGPGRMGGAAARGLDAHPSRAHPAPLRGRAFLRRPDRHLRLAPPRPSAYRRTPHVSRRRPDLRPHRRAHALAARPRRRDFPARRPAGARAAAAADAARVAVRPRRDRAGAARRALSHRRRRPGGGGAAGADPRDRRDRPAAGAGAHAGRDRELRRSHADGESDGQPRVGGAAHPRDHLETHRPQRYGRAAAGAVQGGTRQAGRASGDQGRRALDARGGAAHAAATGGRSHRRRRDHCASPGARAAAQLGDAGRSGQGERRPPLLRHLPPPRTPTTAKPRSAA